jgi:hypothetical protein
MKMSTEVSTITDDQLKRLEEKVRRGAAAFIETGQALAKIREGKGYLLRGYKTWEDYCQKEFGITDRHGRRLIQSAETAVEVKKLTGSAPSSEFATREYISLVSDPDKLKKVAKTLETQGYTVLTAPAEVVKEAAQKLAPKPKPATVPGNGKAVVIPTHLSGYVAKPIAQAMAVSVAPVNDEPSGECPYCAERPDSWIQSEEVWECSNCRGIVLLKPTKWPPETDQTAQDVPTCPHCKKPIGDGAPFCTHCGSILE